MWLKKSAVEFWFSFFVLGFFLIGLFVYLFMYLFCITS